MNTPNKITLARIILAVILLVMMILPWYNLGVTFPVYKIGNVSISLDYIIEGLIFLVASASDFLDGYLARKNNEVTDFGKVMDAIADKLLVNGVLIILAYNRLISVIVPVVIISRDIVVDSCKMLSGNHGKVVAASILGKIKTICMMIGITLTFFYNLPFELISLPIADLFLIIAVVFSIVSGCQYFYNVKDLMLPKTK